MSRPEVMQRLHENLEAWNERDWRRFQGLFSDDAIYEEEATGESVRGPDEIVALQQPWIYAFPDLQGVVREVFVSRNRAVMEVLFTGTHRRTLVTERERIEPTGTSVSLPALLVYKIDGLHATEVHRSFDLAALLAQLGVNAPMYGAPTR